MISCILFAEVVMGKFFQENSSFPCDEYQKTILLRQSCIHKMSVTEYTCVNHLGLWRIESRNDFPSCWL